jgi:gliding motility-associated-like protein
MRGYLLLLVSLLSFNCFAESVSPPPLVDFTFDNNNTCSGTTIHFSSTVSGDAPFSYSWNFGDSGTSSAANPSHSFVSFGCGSQNFSVSLTVTDANNLTTSITKIITVKQKPDINFVDQNNLFDPFNNCTGANPSSPNYSILLGNASTSSCFSSVVVNWGDSSSQTNPAFPVAHTYLNLGAYQLTITVTGTNGCVSVQNYIVKNISNPSGSLTSPGGTINLCAPTSNLQFAIGGDWGVNSDDTIYTINYGDNTPVLTFTQAQLESSPYFNSASPIDSNDYPIPHSYLISSCPGGSFTATLEITNACSATPFTTSNIVILKKPEASFQAPANACVNTNVTFTNTTATGFNQNCNQQAIYTWNFGDGSPVVTTPMTLPQNITHLYSTAGTYNVTLTAQGFCGISTFSKTICIEPPLSPQFTLNQTQGCAPQTITAINNTNTAFSCGAVTYTWSVSHAPGFCGTTISQIPNQTTTNATYNFTEPGTYTITLTTTNSCGTTQTSQTVIVKKPPTASINTIANLCGAGSITPQATVNSCAPAGSALTYAWTFPGGTPATSNAANPGTVSYTAPGPHTVSLVVGNECGNAAAATQTFTLNPAPAITNTNLSQTICSGTSTSAIALTSSITGATFSWTATASAGVTGFQPSGTSATIPAQIINYSGSSTGTLTYTVTPTAAGCAGTPATFQIQIIPAPAITAQPQPQTVCQNGTTNPISILINAGPSTPTYQWYSNTSNSTSGGTLLSGATSSSFTPPSSTVGTLYYYVVISLGSGGCAALTSQAAAITVQPLPQITLQPQPSQQVCVGGTIGSALSVSVSGGFGGTTYQWYSSTSNSTIGGSPISGATSASYSPPAFITPGTFYYYVVATSAGSGCGVVTSQIGQVTVIADPVVDTQPIASQTLCQGAVAQALSVSVSGGIGTLSYQWFSNTSNSTTGGISIAGATNVSFVPPTAVVGTKYYYCIITQSTPGCGATSAVAAVTVNTSPSVTSQPISSQVCPGGTVQALTLATANGVGTASYQWFSNTTASNTGGSLISGATNATFSPPTTTAGTIWYYAEITFSGIVGSCATIATQPASVEVITPAQITQQPMAAQQICVGGSVSNPLSVTLTGGFGTVNYQWYSNSSNSTVGGTPITGATGSSYTPPVFIIPGNFYFYAIASFAGSGCSTATSQVAQVTVLPDPLVDLQPIASQTLCQGATPQILSVAVSGGFGDFSYQWYSNTNNSNTGGTLIPSATNPDFIPQTTIVGTTYYYCIITQATTPGCGVTSATAAVTVNLSPLVTSQPAPSQVCPGGTPQTLSFTTANGVGTATYQWFSNTSASNTGGLAIADGTGQTFTPPTTTVGSVWYYAEITFSGIVGSCATIATQATLVEVTPAAQVSQQPLPSQTVCVGTGITTPLSVTYTGGSGTPQYQWYVNTQNSTSGGTPVGTNSDTYSPPVFTIAGNYYYYVSIQLSASGCAPVTSDVANVIVVADPQVSSQPMASQTLCPDEIAQALSVGVTGGIGTSYDYQWYVSATSIAGSGTPVSGATTATYTPPTDTPGTLYYYCIILQPGTTGCNAESAMGAITVSPAPAITAQPLSQTICSGDAIAALGFSVINGVGTANYQWYSNSTAANTGGSAIAGATSTTYLPNATTVGTFYYYGVVTYPGLAGACSSVATDVAIITVEQNPIISPKSDTICSATSFTVSPISAGLEIVPASTVYTWTVQSIIPAGAVTGASDQTAPQTEISQQLVNVTTSPATVTYLVTPVAGNCPGLPFTVVITVNPAINPNIIINDNLCFGADSASIVTNVTGGIPFSGGQPYQFSWNGPNGFASSANSISNLAPGNYTVTITDAGGCPFSQVYTITEPAQLVFGITSETDVTCNGAADGSISINANGGTPGYTYSWTKNTAFYSNAQNLTGLAPGLYQVTISDANNCGPITMAFTITEPQPLVATTASQTNVQCFGQNTGALSVAVTGGTMGYSYSWTGPNNFASTDQDIAALYAGVYNLSVTDANGCQFLLSATVTQSPEIIISYTATEITCYGANDANMSVQLGGGIAPYTFVWSNLSTSLNQTNLSAGDYTITVTDALGCIKALTINIPEAPIFTVNPVVTQISCHNANDGSIQLNLVGGISPVTLVWSDGSSAGLTRNGLSAGVYTATITDSKPCQIVRTFVIVNPQAITLSGLVDNAIDCSTTNTGAIDVTVAGGTPPYTYSWTNGSSSEDLTGLTNGNYAVTVTDSRGCTAIGQYTVLRPDPLAITVNTQTDFDCETHQVDQQFIAQVSGGVPPFQLQWSSGNISGTNGEIMQTDVNGIVELTATDANGCVATYTVNVETPELGYIDFEPQSFGNVTYGIFSIYDPITFTSDITGDYQSIIWDFGDGTFSNEMDPVHTYSTAGSYVVTQIVTYPFGCQYTRIVTLLIEEGYFLVVPTAFTPNDDSVNDNYRPISKRLENIKMEIYDSWGSMIYSETGDVLVGWDGNISSVPAENGNYYCKVTAKTFYNHTITETKTFVLIK